VAAFSLPDQWDGLRAFAVGMWALAAFLLVALIGATIAHWRRYPSVARSHLAHPVLGHFYGAPAMALLTVGAGTLLVGRDVLGLPLAVRVDSALWLAGTVIGLTVAVAVPTRTWIRRGYSAENAFGGWLMPIVPPMVSASTGALLVPHTSAGALRLSLLSACYLMFGLALAGSVIVIALICVRIARHGAGEPRLVPTLWIVLGPLGQSITAANLLGGVAHLVWPGRTSAALSALAVGYGVVAWCAAAVWMAVAVTFTARAVARGLPFTLTWWSFTFPVGTCVTGSSALAVHTGLELFRIAAVLGCAVLVAAWVVVAARTAHGVGRGYLLLAPVTAN
jgi:C4-dicarboxylate transporter/malic acid transport protein